MSLIQLDALFRTNNGGGWKDNNEEQFRTIKLLDSIEGEEKISPTVSARNSLFSDIDGFLNGNYTLADGNELWTQKSFSTYHSEKVLELGSGPGFIKSRVLGYLRNNN